MLCNCATVCGGQKLEMLVYRGEARNITKLGGKRTCRRRNSFGV